MTNRHLKRCSISAVSREMQIKTAVMSFWPSSKTLQITNAGEGVEKRAPSYTVGAGTMENSMEVPPKLQIVTI